MQQGLSKKIMKIRLGNGYANCGFFTDDSGVVLVIVIPWR